MKHNLLDSSIGYLINRTSLNLNNLLARRLRDFEITPEQFVLLSRLREEEGLSQKELALRSEKDPPGVTRMLDNMLSKDLIIREQNDRRTFSIFLTEKARSIYNELERIENNTMREITEELTEEELNTLFNLLGKVKQSIDKLS